MELNVNPARRGSPDGVSSVSYGPGVGDVPEDLAAVFLAEGWAEHPKKAPADPPVVAPAAPVAPKAAPAAPEPVAAPRNASVKALQRRKQGKKS